MSGVFCTLLEFFPVWKYHRYPSIISAVVSFLVYRYCFSILHLHVNHCTPPKSLHRRDSKVVIASMQPYFFLHFQHISNFIYKLTFSMGRGKEWIDRDIKTARLFSGLLEGMLLFTSCSFFFPSCLLLPPTPVDLCTGVIVFQKFWFSNFARPVVH